MKNIVWLASYPKSGNTWLRLFLIKLMGEHENPLDINQLGTIPVIGNRIIFDQITGYQSSDLLQHEIDLLRPSVYKNYSSKATETLFIKAHDAYTYLDDGNPIFPIEATKGAVYLIRNPLDIAPSFAHHSAVDVDEIIHNMNDVNTSFSNSTGNLEHQLRQHVLSWDDHVQSWMTAKDIDIHFVRFEDMVDKPLQTFRSVVQFAGLQNSDEEIIQALEACSFGKLKILEQNAGFCEKSTLAPSSSFFRKGKVGSWTETLSARQAAQILNEHVDVMTQFGYLDESGQLTSIPSTVISNHSALLQAIRKERAKTHYHYRLYGLVLSLPFMFDELSASHEPACVQVSLQKIECKDVNWRDETIGYRAKPGLCIIKIPGVASYLIRDGQEIIIEVEESNTDMKAVKLFLLNSVFSILLIQRGQTPFWGSTVVYNERAFALLGRSSVGKSLLAAGLKQKGFLVLSENLCVLSGEQSMEVLPGYPFLMLWRKGLNLLNETHSSLSCVRSGLQKFRYPLGEDFCASPVPLAGIYLLTPHNKETYQFENLTGFDKSLRLMNFTFNEPIAKAAGMQECQHKAVHMAATRLPVRAYSYMMADGSLQESLDYLAQSIMNSADQLL